ncbi:TonB-dependent receptor, partial [bacterium]|nr:TonB-dependent receptor [candidate division CSSED10-310 bacterium]
KMKFRFLSVALLVSIFSGSFLSVPAYSQTGKIVGTVKDAGTGEALAGANIIVSGTYLGAAADTDGHFIIVNVSPGVYELEVSVMGYKKMKKTGVMVSINQISTVNFALESTVIEGEEIVVVAERDILHKEVPNTQLVVTTRQITEAAGVRTINNYLEKQPGITGANHLEIRGGSAEQTGAIVDGMTMVDVRMGRAESSIPLSAVEQVSLVTGGFNAEYGNFRSGLINITTKSGDQNRYHGRMSYTQNLPKMKRFGKSMYDPSNYALLPYMDPVVGFAGTIDGWLQYTNGDEEEATYLSQGHDAFGGWISLTDFFNRRNTPYIDANPMDLYLWSCWNHMLVPDFDKLEELYPEWTTEDPDWGKKKEAIKDHAHELEGERADYNIDGGFGGPVPLIGKYLGNATFFLSNQTMNINYIQPIIRDADWKTTTLLTLKSHLSHSMTLTFNGMYRYIEGVAEIQNIALSNPSLEGRGGFMFENNVGNMRDVGETYYWHPTYFHPKNQTTVSAGLKLNHVIGPKTFWDLSVQYVRNKDYMDTESDLIHNRNNAVRDRTTLINFGPIWLDDLPYGRPFYFNTAGIDTVYNPADSSQYTIHDGLSSLYGLGRRYSGKTGGYYDRSTAQQFRLRYDLSSQVSNAHFIKTGAEFNYIDLNNDMFQYGYLDKAEREFRFRREPWVLAGYFQDQITIEGMVATLGLRVDYYNSGGDVWPTGHPFDPVAFSTYEARNQELRDRLDAGESVIWTRWNTINDTTGGILLEKTENFFTVSPRVGIAFPVTERSKFYFNYGHFRATPPYSEMFLYTMNFRDIGLRSIGNPNLEPPRTIQYELGVAYNLSDQYLINLSTYYKDVTGQHGNITYQNSDGTVRYDSRLNNEYEDIMGFEVNITKEYGRFLTGWLTYRYLIRKYGNTGRDILSDDPSWNEVNGLYESEESRPTTRPVFTGNMTLHSPFDWGPRILNHNFLGGLMLSLLGRWEKGATFTWNPAGLRNITDNLRWPDQFNFDLKAAKRFLIRGINANVYVDVLNVFNIKTNWMSSGWCFRNSSDREKYLASLHLSMYDDPRYDTLRENNPGLYIAGDDKPGDLRENKSYINDPDNEMFLYGYPRQIWFGIDISF